MTAPVRMFRLLAAEFAAVPDDTVETWHAITAPLISQSFFGGVYNQAWVLFTAHWMKLAEMARDEADGVFPVQSVSEDGGSMTLALNVPNVGADDGSLNQTKYGQMYLEIRRRMAAGPII